MSGLVDPRERIGCACHRIDGRDCIRFRVSDDLRTMLDVEPSKLRCDDDDECGCACHEDYDASLDDDDSGAVYGGGG